MPCQSGAQEKKLSVLGRPWNFQGEKQCQNCFKNPPWNVFTQKLKKQPENRKYSQQNKDFKPIYNNKHFPLYFLECPNNFVCFLKTNKTFKDTDDKKHCPNQCFHVFLKINETFKTTDNERYCFSKFLNAQTTFLHFLNINETFKPTGSEKHSL